MLELRVGSLLVFAAYLFSLDAKVLSSYRINISHAFGYRTPSKSPRRVAHYMAFTLCTGAILFGLQRLLFPRVQSRLVALATLCCILALILSQSRLFRVLRRICIGRISAENRLGDILVSDALVSMASIFVDVAYAFSLSYYGVPASDRVSRPQHIGYKTLLVACIPQGIRIKQCIIDYRRTKNKQHLLNLLKYLVGNMPHALRSNIASLSTEIPEEANIRYILEGMLVKSLVLNAIYSLTWDIVVDWQLSRLKSQQGASLKFPVGWYYTAAALDAVLRFAFLAASPNEPIIFSLQALELTRRAIWILFRVESEPIELSDEIEMEEAPSRSN